MYNIAIPDSVYDKKNIVFPISMNQPLERGKPLELTLNALSEISSKSNASITILICDYLNRHNVGERKSLEMGDNFINEYKHLFKNLKILRWKDYIESIKSFQSTLSMIENVSPEKSLFYGKMRKVYEQCKSAYSLASSIAYQREEFAAILLMDMFDAILYPKKPTYAMRYLYSNIEGRKPEFISFKINQKKIRNKHEFFKEPKSTHMHIAFRVLLDNINSLLESSEISPKEKMIFIERLKEDVDFIVESKLKANTKTLTS